MDPAKKQRKPTKSLRKGKKLEAQASPSISQFKLVAVKTVSWAHD